MSGKHLSAEQLTGWMVGDRTPFMTAHLAVCEDCQAKLQKTESLLANFGVQVRSWSASQMQGASPFLTKPSRKPSLPLWSYGLATAALAVLTFLWQDHAAVHKNASAVSHTAALTDTALLLQLDRQISETVPTPMQPLTQLVGWQQGNDGATAGTGAAHYVE